MAAEEDGGRGAQGEAVLVLYGPVLLPVVDAPGGRPGRTAVRSHCVPLPAGALTDKGAEGRSTARGALNYLDTARELERDLEMDKTTFCLGRCGLHPVKLSRAFVERVRVKGVLVVDVAYLFQQVCSLARVRKGEALHVVIRSCLLAQCEGTRAGLGGGQNHVLHMSMWLTSIEPQ